MKNYLIGTVLASSLVMTIVSCGNKSPGQAAQSLKNQITGQSDQTRNTFALAGDWSTPCVPLTGVVGDLKYATEQYHFGDDKSLTRKLFTYSDAGCTSQGFVRIENGTIDPQGSSTTKEGLVVVFNFQNVQIIPATESGTKALNLVSFCGHSHYTTGGTTDVTDHSGDAVSCLKLVDKSPRQTHDLVKQIADNQIAFGGDADLTLDKALPADVNRTAERTFTKK